jgi:molybdopterin-guanine dinucleotide biosynthesis protein A
MLTLCVQAGGKSSRMGVDKALLNFGGQKLIQQVLSRLDSLAQETIITTNRPEGYRFLELPLIRILSLIAVLWADCIARYRLLHNL